MQLAVMSSSVPEAMADEGQLAASGGISMAVAVGREPRAKNQEGGCKLAVGGITVGS